VLHSVSFFCLVTFFCQGSQSPFVPKPAEKSTTDSFPRKIPKQQQLTCFLSFAAMR